MISLITALYNSEKFLPAYEMEVMRFAKILQNKKQEFEIIIQVTNPTPKETDIIERLGKNPWCRTGETERRGVYAAWNDGVMAAKGECIGFWNVDDVRFVPAVLEAERLLSSEADVVYFPFTIERYITVLDFSIKVRSKSIDGPKLDFDAKRFSRGMVCGPHFMFKKSLYNEIGPFDEQFKFAGDFDWCVRAVRHTQKFLRGAEYSGLFRVDGSGLSSGKLPWRTAELNLIFTRYGHNDLLAKADPEEEKNYKPGEFLFRQQWHPLSEFSTTVNPNKN